ncbi:MAG TPA: GLUG motif-containing protein [Rhizomicrobium sp.]|jgi:filamentous hemagglutinin family protein
MNQHSAALLSMGVSLVALMLGADTALAAGLPSAGGFVAGHGAIGKAARSLTVTQSSITGIIDWNSFSIGKHESVTFDNGAGATLNRVTGGNLSRIAGSLNATGSLYLLNSSGMIVSGTGRIVTGGDFVASGGAFADDWRRFASADGRIVNRGSIASGGAAKLVGGSIVNVGTISASRVKLRAADGAVVAGGSIDAVGSARHGAHIRVISDNGETRVTGTLSARNRDGSGGLIETSGHRVAIGGAIDAGDGGTWLVDPENLTVDATAAKTIDNSLNAGTSVTLKTTATGASGPGTTASGTGNIVIASGLAWNTAATLRLDAYHSIIVKKAVNVAGRGGVTLLTGDGGTSGSVAFESGSFIFDNLSSVLSIGGTRFTLVGSLATLAHDIAARPTGDYALAANYDAKADGTYARSPIATTFSGVFNGLGNTISDLSIGAAQLTNVGLFASVAAQGTVENLSLANANIVGGTAVGALVGANAGMLKDDSVAGMVNGDTYVGGMAGTNEGKIDGVSSSAAVEDQHGTQQPGNTHSLVGGLVGFNESSGLIEYSSASGSVTATNSSDVAGLAGRNSGTVEDSDATGAVHGFNAVGGLAGNSNGTVEDSWASGAVQGMRYAGGLIGFSDIGLVEESFASGLVVADTGGKDEGGLVGYLAGSAELLNCYATGAVKGNKGAGGLVGLNEAKIQDAYATGAVSGRANVGGAIGENAGTLSSLYWDKKTSGTSIGVGLQDAGAKGSAVARTTAKFRAALPSGFSSSIWAIDPSINHGFPYLIALASSY